MVTYLLPSWAYTVSQPEAARNIVDLLVFCEQPFCALLPPSCRQLVSNDGVLSPAPVLFPTNAGRGQDEWADMHNLTYCSDLPTFAVR